MEVITDRDPGDESMHDATDCPICNAKRIPTGDWIGHHSGHGRIETTQIAAPYPLFVLLCICGSSHMTRDTHTAYTHNAATPQEDERDV